VRAGASASNRYLEAKPSTRRLQILRTSWKHHAQIVLRVVDLGRLDAG